MKNREVDDLSLEELRAFVNELHTEFLKGGPHAPVNGADLVDFVGDLFSWHGLTPRETEGDLV